MDSLRQQLILELSLIWKAHLRIGLTGKMCLYSMNDSRPWPAKTPGIIFWFGPDEINKAADFFLEHYHKGVFPYTALLLNPIVHQQNANGTYEKLGSGVYWATVFGPGKLAEDKKIRIESTKVAVGHVARGEIPKSGFKIIGFAEQMLLPTSNNTVDGCESLYKLADVAGDSFWPYYLLSGVTYPSNVGAYHVAPIMDLGPELATLGENTSDGLNQFIETHSVDPQTVDNAAICWDRYDRLPKLYERFGNDVEGLDENLKFYYYCARDFELFDAIGPQSVKKDSAMEGGFDFLVHGLIPRGSIVLMAATGGTGKSSAAHQLCCLAATDWRDDEQPMWLGQPLNKKRSKGIVVYFSGEDGPAIINARNEIFDPEGRAQRLMFQRNYFVDAHGGEITFPEFLDRLRAMPEVPLLVVDPARKYLTGDEDDAAVVSQFFEAIERFAHERNTAVIVVHHLSKGARPTSAREVLDELRGSQVFIDRPRVVIGMFREGPKTIIGLAKCNIPPSLGMVVDERVFAHNPKNLQLTQLPGKDGVRNTYMVMGEGEDDEE